MRLLIALCFILYEVNWIVAILPPSCSSEIYCHGKLLHSVQMAKLFTDSKSFVDMKLRYSPNVTLNGFEVMSKSITKPTRHDLKQFVEEYFEVVNELRPWVPPDWRPDPSISNKVLDKRIQKWTLAINDIWKNLSRIVNYDVKLNPDKYSLIYVPNGFVIPGGRFRELYYWDTYWIVKGLILSDMKKTAKGVIENLLYLAENIGHIPNGNRVYYLRRSQPPLLVQMVDYYFQQTDDDAFLRKAFPIMKKEMQWWIDNRAIRIKSQNKTKYIVFKYDARSKGPRPESYREDIETVRPFKLESEKVEKFIALKSGAESGWDFSSRWFIKDKTNEGTLKDIDTTNILPVDLNAIMQKNFQILSNHAALLDDSSHDVFVYLAKELQKSLDDVFYSQEDGIWYDYDIKNKIPRNYFYLSNFVPLWTKSYDPKKATALTKSVLLYVMKYKLLNYPGGSPTSENETGQQWDMPNAWPPLQSMLIFGLHRLGTVRAMKVAQELAKTWLLANFREFQNSSKMYEKYDCNTGGPGGGGEYDIQTGFGWTNGIILEMLSTWPNFIPKKNKIDILG